MRKGGRARTREKYNSFPLVKEFQYRKAIYDEIKSIFTTTTTTKKETISYDCKN